MIVNRLLWHAALQVDGNSSVLNWRRSFHDKAEVRDFVGSGIPTVDICRRGLAAVAFVVTFDCEGSPQCGYLV